MMRRLNSGLGRHWEVVAPALMLVAVAGGGLAFGSVILQRTLTSLMIAAVLAIGLYVFTNSGILSFGHMSFMAVGAYVTSWLTIPPLLKQSFFEFPSWLDFLYDAEFSWVGGLGVAVVVSALAGLAVGAVLMRLSGIQASIATLALLLITNVVASNAEGITQGQRTMVGVPQTVDLASSTACALVVLMIAYVYQLSRPGRRLRASREDENAAAVLGIDVGRERLIAFVLSAAMCGVGGVLYAHFATGFSPDHFFLNRTFIIVAMLIVGGRYSLAGTVIGVVAISIAQEILRELEAGVTILGEVLQLPTGSGDGVLGLLMLIVLITRPDGVVGPQGLHWPPRLPAWRKGRRAWSAPEQPDRDQLPSAQAPDAERSAAL